jgi:YqaJ-like viral recombinase domain
MTIEIIPIESREQWLELRKADITASDIGAVCGVNPYRSPLQVWMEKKGLAPGPDDNAAMKRGRWFEASVQMALMEQRLDIEIWAPRQYWRDTELRIGATPDLLAAISADSIAGESPPVRFVIDTKVISEASFRANWLDEEEEEDEEPSGTLCQSIVPPIHYQLQVLTQAALVQCPEAILAVLVFNEFGARLEQCPVDLRQAFEAGRTWDFVKERVGCFRELLESDTPPPVNPEMDAKAVAALYPRDDGPALDWTDRKDIARILVRWESIERQRKGMTEMLNPLDKERKILKTELLGMLGMSQKAIYPGYEISAKIINRKAVPATNFKKLTVKRA